MTVGPKTGPYGKSQENAAAPFRAVQKKRSPLASPDKFAHPALLRWPARYRKFQLQHGTPWHTGRMGLMLLPSGPDMVRPLPVARDRAFNAFLNDLPQVQGPGAGNSTLL